MIVDEIHAMLNDKRGAHLALSLERLENVTSNTLLRIGLSATQKPLHTVAHFLTGNGQSAANIIHIGYARHLELSIEVPKTRLESVASTQQWNEIYDYLSELIRVHRSTLIFANTRKVAERTAHHLGERMDPSLVATHHGSLSKKLRLEAERKLKQGELKALVATASLELGIDIGHVDLVCQLGSPRSIAVMLQRIGRSGHWHGAISKGRLFATTRDELVECVALVQAIGAGDLDTLVIPHEPLDVLTQQIVAACVDQDWTVDALFTLVRRAYPYQQLSKETFMDVLEMLSTGISGIRGKYGSYLFYDKSLHIIKAKRGARLTAIMNGGVIPDNALFNVVIEDTETNVGTLDEDFAIESNPGDIFLLGSTSWKVKQVQASKGKVMVENAQGAAPNVPFWRGEAPERTAELSRYVSDLRQTVSDKLRLNENVVGWLQTMCHLNDDAALQMIQYIQEGQAVLGQVPTQSHVIAERFFDEAGGMHLIIHAPFGARINKAWGLALRKCFCRSFNIELQASATDDGLHIALTEQHSFPLSDVFRFLKPETFKKNLTQAVLQSPIFTTRWRWTAGRSLAMIRYRSGKKIPPYILRVVSEDLLASIFPDVVACQDNLAGRDISIPDHPLVNEALKEALNEALNIEGMAHILRDIQQNKIQCIAIDTPIASVFSHEILNANPFAFLDDTPLEERRARAVEMRQVLPESVLKNLGRLDVQVIKEVQQQAWPDLRDADELQDFLQTVVVFPEEAFKKDNLLWQNFFQELEAAGRAAKISLNGNIVWISRDNEASVRAMYELINPDTEIIFQTIRGWIQFLGPVTSAQLSTWLQLPMQEIDNALYRIENTGLILRGQFLNTNLEWCERRLLARIHRFTIQKLRQQISPVSLEHFFQWLMRWQHFAPDTQLQGERGLLEIITQLQGFEVPAKFWEKDIFAKRLKNYTSDLLDHLCLMGIVGWGRFSYPVSNKHDEHIKRVIPNSVAPIAFFVRKEASWMSNILKMDHLANLSSTAQDIHDYLKSHGAAFLTDIVEDTRYLKSEAEMALWELVTAGLATADSFDNLRAFIDPRRRLRKKRYRTHSALNAGRWSLLKIPSSSTNVEAHCWLLLKRYGVVFRDLLAKEKLIPKWRELLACFKHLEAQGEIRSGRFIEHVKGEQFALPFAVESLRADKDVLSTLEINPHHNDPLAVSFSFQ